MIARELIALFGIQLDASSLDKAGNKINSFAATATRALGLIGGAYALKKLGDYVIKTANWGDELERTAKRLGIQTDMLQGLQRVAATVDITQEQLTVGLGFFARNLGKVGKSAQDAADGSAKLEDVFKGVDWKGVQSGAVDLGQAFLQVADHTATLKTATEKAAYVTGIFGARQIKFVDVITMGRPAIEKFIQQLKDTGQIVSAENIAKLAEFDNQWKELNAQFSVMGKQMASELMPLLIRIMKWVLNEGIPNIKLFIASIGGLRPILTVLGVGILLFLGHLALVNIAFIGWTLVISAVILIITDLYSWLTGGKSIIGDFFGSLKEGFEGLDPLAKAGVIAIGIVSAFLLSTAVPAVLAYAAAWASAAAAIVIANAPIFAAIAAIGAAGWLLKKFSDSEKENPGSLVAAFGGTPMPVRASAFSGTPTSDYASRNFMGPKASSGPTMGNSSYSITVNAKTNANPKEIAYEARKAAIQLDEENRRKENAAVSRLAPVGS